MYVLRSLRLVVRLITHLQSPLRQSAPTLLQMPVEFFLDPVHVTAVGDGEHEDANRANVTHQ